MIEPDTFHQHLPFYKWDEPDKDWICEEHPFFYWPHDDCAGPGMLAVSLLGLIRQSEAPVHPVELIDIVFDGPPGHQTGRFVEIERQDGSSVKVGEWIERNDGYWVLRTEVRIK